MRIHPPYAHYKFFRKPRDLFSAECAIDASILINETLIKTNVKHCLGFRSTLITKPLFQCLALTADGPADLNKVLIAFRGTIGLKDWLVDLEIEKNSSGFHKGFWEAVRALMPEIVMLCVGKDVRCTGHSLGAAMAAIAAFKLRGTAKSVSIVNFGQPKIGDQQAVDMLKGIPWGRFIHGDDLITEVPPNALDYVHGGNFIHLPQVKHHFWQYFSHEAPYFIPVDLWDHIPTNYAKRIWQREEAI